jgi:exopolysaccharide production protein ExoY
MPLTDVGIPLWKRILDVSFILVSLPLALPVFFLIALWIKMASPGPLFFKQKRIGFGGRHFTLFKFRTMKCNVETSGHEQYFARLIGSNAPMTKLDTFDPRIISGGRILRASGLDELPQIFNILRGEMSLVGPRPCTLAEWQGYKIPHRARANAAPGLTGYWQVNGKNKTTFVQMIEMDIWYTKNLSLFVDLGIILRTVPAILSEVFKRKRTIVDFQPNLIVLEGPPEEEEVSA